VVRLVRDGGFADLGAEQVFLQLAPLPFDASTLEIWGALLGGGRLVLAPPGALSLAELGGWLEREQVTTLWLTAGLFHEMATQQSRGLGGLRQLLAGGDVLLPQVVERVLLEHPGLTLINGYGPTENTTFSSCHRLASGTVGTVGTAAPAVGSSVPIGRPIGGSEAYVVDGWSGAAPVGVAGELLVGGAGLARGYVQRPEQTAERWVPDGMSGGSGRRLYRTGDRVRWLPGGALQFLGRLDGQVKVRGHRIEPFEVESALLGTPGVEQAAVVAVAQGADRRLVACVVLAPGRQLSLGEVREQLRSRLPEALVPTGLAVLASLPLTARGKVDRRALQALAATAVGAGEGEHGPGAASGRPAAAPSSPVEEILASIWGDVLGVPRVGMEDNFFDLGGHSLLATRVVARLRTVLGVELALHQLFEAPTVAGLAREIERASRSAAGTAAPAIERAPRGADEEPPPLSFAQERLWFLQQLDPSSAAYDMPCEIELVGTLHAGALIAALSAVVRRHESLRTTFASPTSGGGVLSQRIAPPAAAVALPRVDLAALPEAAGRAAAAGLARQHTDWRFDLERGPLCVWLLVRLSEQRHQFFLNLHHTIADGWSIAVLAREVGELYAAALEGRPSRLPELPIQYADYARWQRRWLVAEQETELAYWEARLAGEVASAELPTDRPRPAVQTFRGGQCRRVLPAGLTERLKRFGREESVTLFMTLLAAAQALIARHSGEPDVAVGAPIAGRQRAETEGLIGCFLNTLVLRTDTSGRPSFRELTARVRAVTLGAYAHQRVPFEAILARLGLRRDLSRAPLFQVLFNLLNLPEANLALPGIELQPLPANQVPSKLDVTFYIAELEPCIDVDLVYNADLFDAARMDDLLAQLELFLEQALERPEAPVADLPLLTAGMRQVLPDPALALDASWMGSVYELFAAAAARAPQRTAVAGEAGARSYGDLLLAARRVSGWLTAQGVRQGEPVAILANRAVPLVEAVLGVLGAGAAFMMLDAAYPGPRQLEMLRLACPRAWITVGPPAGRRIAAGREGGARREGAAAPARPALSEGVAGEETVAREVRAWLRETGCPVLDLPPGGALAVADLAPFAWEATEVRVGPRDVACIGFTSGSSGGPKGILGLHGSLSHFLPTHCRQFGLGADDRFSLLSGLGHDPLQREIFTALYLGGTIVVPDPADYGLSGRLAAWLCREQVTVAHLTPTLGQLLTELPPDGRREPVASLRRVLLVGESLTRQDVARLCALAPAVACINLYGSTETQRAVAFHPVAPEEAEAAGERAQQVLPLGRGVPDVQLLVLNPAAALAGLGELGEIAVRSPHLARGYLGNAELTAQRFQINPFTGEAADRIYRTGDQGRYRADGEVVFAGRGDQQIKLRGFRIELGEIEGVLAGLAGVAEAVVLLRSDLPLGAGLVAYVRTEEGRERSLRRELEARLPAYMVPAAFVQLDQLPRTANGKVDRRALLQIAPRFDGPAGRTLLKSAAEEILAGIWAQVLGREQVGAEDNFFDLGGHSLLATRMASRVREVLGVELPLRSLFVTPVLAQLAAEIERRRRGAPEMPTIASFRRERGAPPPVSFAQQRYWTGRHLEARSVASTIPMLTLVEGPIDPGCVRRALAAVVERHELLRTSFWEGPEGLIQVIHPTVPVNLPTVDLAALGEAEWQAEVRRWTSLDGQRHFDYERAPFFRATLFRRRAEEHLVLFTIHHVASDWWSGFVLLREVAAFYLAFRDGRPPALPPLAAQFQDFARWQRRLSLEEEQASQVTFWREQLSGAVPIDLNPGRPRPRQRSFAAGNEEIVVTEEFERQLEAFSAGHGVTLFMTLLAAFKALLYLETGVEDLVVPCSFANRHQIETEAMIGNFASGLPLRTRLAGVHTFRELLLQVRDVALLAHDHPDIFYEPVVAGMSFLEEGDRGGLTTFRVQFQLLKWEPPTQVSSNLRVSRLPTDTGKMRLDLSLFLYQADHLFGRFRYSRDLLDQPRVAAMRDRYLRILAAVVADPECPLAELAPDDAGPREPLARELALQ
jgi:amino acid adenylation domain-containing protein